MFFFWFLFLVYDTPYLLSYCNYKYEKKNEKRTFARLWYCKIKECRSRSEIYFDLLDHIKNKHISNVLENCEYCSFKIPNTFFKTRVLMEHFLKVHSKVEFRCFACYLTSHTLDDHYDHLFSNSTNFRNNICLKCNEYIKSPCLYDSHNIFNCCQKNSLSRSCFKNSNIYED